jgi:hypothetical protein
MNDEAVIFFQLFDPVRRFLAASAWLAAAALMSCFGLIHAFAITTGGIVSDIGLWRLPAFTLSYAAGACFCSYATGTQGAIPHPTFKSEMRSRIAIGYVSTQDLLRECRFESPICGVDDC